MQRDRRIIDYSEATLDTLDAGVCVRVPKGRDNQYHLYGVPKFLIIGAQKCGTTAMRRWLSIHPELQTIPLEWNFFDEVGDLATEWPRYIIHPHFKLRQHGVRYTFEKTPGYFHKKNQGIPVPDMVHQLMPSGKFIVMLRNPTERAWSAYRMYENNQKQPLYGCTLRDSQLRKLAKRVAQPLEKEATPNLSFLDLIENLMAIAKKDRSTNVDPRIENVLLVGHYAEHLQTWFNRFSRSQILVIFLEDFKKEPFLTMDKIFSFLDITPIDYRLLTKPTLNGFWDLEGYNQTPKKRKSISIEIKELLDSYYSSWNNKLEELLPESEIPWLP